MTNHKSVLTILFGLYVIWTGLLRGIEAAAYKPNALWFCMSMGLMAIAGAFLLRLEKRLMGSIVSTIPAAIVLAYYLSCFIQQPEKDASYRVGLVIVAAIAQLVVVFFPAKPQPSPSPQTMNQP